MKYVNLLKSKHSEGLMIVFACSEIKGTVSPDFTNYLKV